VSKTKKPRKPNERKPVVWPPEEWPEEARQAQIAVINEFMEEWWKLVLADMAFAPSAEIIPFPKARTRTVKARDTSDQGTGYERPGHGIRATRARDASDQGTGCERPKGVEKSSQVFDK